MDTELEEFYSVRPDQNRRVVWSGLVSPIPVSVLSVSLNVYSGLQDRLADKRNTSNSNQKHGLRRIINISDDYRLWLSFPLGEPSTYKKINMYDGGIYNLGDNLQQFTM